MIRNIDVVVVGSANIDQTVILSSLPRPGETLTGSELMIAEGGKGANQAVAAARLGATTAFVGCVGDDGYGLRMRKKLEAENIWCDFLATKNAVPTGSAFIFIDDNGRNMIAIVAGANGKITCEDINNSSELISKSKVMLLQHDIPQEVINHSAQIAHSAGVKVILNPAPARDIPLSLFKYLACIIPNETEAEKITGIVLSDNKGLDKQADWFHSKLVKVVMITLGEKGVYVSNEKNRKIIPAHKVDVVDTVAAGDCFCGALGASIAAGENWFDAAEFASKAASISVTRRGAIDSIPYIHEM